MFRYSHRLSGGAATVQPIVFKDTERLTDGDLINLEAGQADLAATGDTNLLGCAKETKSGTSGVSTLPVVTDDDAVYAVTDPNARKIGDTLDITGTTGAQTVAASANRDLVVVADSSALQETLVVINRDAHWLTKAQ